jgi:anaerobic selenocysteine-containing dehydrogenase
VIVVDSIRTPTAQQADLHLQPFPGSDAALAFAMLHVIVRDGLADRELLERHAIGWDELEPQLDACTPEWAEPVTGVPAQLIERAATIYGRGPSLLWIGQGLQRQSTGGNVMRAVALLPAVSGNLAKPGAGFLYLNDRFEIDEDWLAAPQLGDPPEPISHMDLAACLEDPARSRSLFCWNINIAASNPEQTRLLAALGRDDLFTVVVDLFATDTGDYADLLLPAASFLEFDDLVSSYFDLSLSAQVKAVDPVGEALPNQEIFRRLATAMGFTEPELHAGDRDGLHRARAARRRPRADRRDAGPVRCDRELRAAGGGGDGAADGGAGGAVCRPRLRDGQRPHRDRVRRG